MSVKMFCVFVVITLLGFCNKSEASNNKPFIRLIHWLLKEGTRPVVITGATTEERFQVADEFIQSYTKLDGQAFTINATNSLSMAQSFYGILHKYDLQEHTNIVDVMGAVCLHFKDVKTLYVFEELELNNKFFSSFLCHDNIMTDILITNSNVDPATSKFIVVDFDVYKNIGFKQVVQSLDKDLLTLYEKQNPVNRLTISQVPKDNVTIPLKVIPAGEEEDTPTSLGREMIRVTEEMKKFKIENKEFVDYVKDSYKVNTFDMAKRFYSQPSSEPKNKNE